MAAVTRKIVPLTRLLIDALSFCEEEEELNFEVMDFGLCSPSLLFKFIDFRQEECKLGHGGRLGYVDAISELIDFRKVNGALMQFWENCLSPSCSTSKERARHWQRWWDCSGRKISTLRHWKQEATGQQWRVVGGREISSAALRKYREDLQIESSSS